MKALSIVAALLLFSLPVQATIVAKKVESTGTIFLHDTPCTLTPQGYHLDARNGRNEITFKGCWMEHVGILYLISENGGRVQLQREEFDWDVGS